MNATSLLVLATAEGADPELQLLPAPAELIWGIVAFALLFLVMSRYALPSMNKMLDERRARIQGQLEEAEEIRNEAEELRRQYQEQLKEARARANEIVDQARADADKVREQKVKDADEEAQAIRQRARDDAEAERSRLVQQLRGQMAALSVDLAGKIVHRELDEEQHSTLVDEYIDQLSNMN
jgi:F-type H+-transporting ATPase subunit b